MYLRDSNQVGLVHHTSISNCKGITQLSTFVDSTGRLGLYKIIILGLVIAQSKCSRSRGKGNHLEIEIQVFTTLPNPSKKEHSPGHENDLTNFSRPVLLRVYWE
jgi:hypothetical protein